MHRSAHITSMIAVAIMPPESLLHLSLHFYCVISVLVFLFLIHLFHLQEATHSSPVLLLCLVLNGSTFTIEHLTKECLCLSKIWSEKLKHREWLHQSLVCLSCSNHSLFGHHLSQTSVWVRDWPRGHRLSEDPQTGMSYTKHYLDKWFRGTSLSGTM